MPKSTAIHPNNEQSPIIPQIEKLLTEQTSVILQAVDEKLSAQDKRIEDGFAAQDKRMEEKFIAQEIRILAAVDKRLGYANLVNQTNSVAVGGCWGSPTKVPKSPQDAGRLPVPERAY